MHMKHKWKKSRAVTVSVYTSAGAEGRMRGGFHARATLARFPNSASVCLQTDTMMGGGDGSARHVYHVFNNTVCTLQSLASPVVS